MRTDEAATYPGGDDWTADDWAAIEARFQGAKRALLEAQQRQCDAAHEFLLARAQVRRMLETVFPGAEAATSQPVSEVRCGCNKAAAQRHEESVSPTRPTEMAVGQHCMGARP